MWWAIGKRWAHADRKLEMKVAIEQICTSASFGNKTFSWCHHFLNRVQKLSYYPATGQYFTCSFLTSFYLLDNYRWHFALLLHCNNLCKLILKETKHMFSVQTTLFSNLTGIYQLSRAIYVLNTYENHWKIKCTCQDLRRKILQNQNNLLHMKHNQFSLLKVFN